MRYCAENITPKRGATAGTRTHTLKPTNARQTTGLRTDTRQNRGVLQGKPNQNRTALLCTERRRHQRSPECPPTTTTALRRSDHLVLHPDAGTSFPWGSTSPSTPHKNTQHMNRLFSSLVREALHRTLLAHYRGEREEDLGLPRERRDRADQSKPEEDLTTIRRSLTTRCCRTEAGEGVRREHAGEEELPVGVVAPRPHRGQEWSAKTYPEPPDMLADAGDD